MSEITATIIQRSKCGVSGKEIITWELVYPRMIHAELLTHRMFSRNSASSRAIPIAKVVEMVRSNMAVPSHWGVNQPGMQAKEELEGFARLGVMDLWCDAALAAANFSEGMAALGAHKQVANRVTEPYQWMKVVLTYTEGNNWYWLRDHTDADPTIHALTQKMVESLEASTPFVIYPGEWHVPYVTRMRDAGGIRYLTDTHITDDEFEVQYLSEDEALAVSSSCCAQVSYRTLDLSLSKAQMIFGRLVESEPVHASPFEHQATPMVIYNPSNMKNEFKDWVNIIEGFEQPGVTHMDRDGLLWSGNFQGYIQHRQLISNNVKKG